MNDPRSMQIPASPQHLRMGTDSTTNALAIVDYDEHEIHDGVSFTANYAVDLGNAATIDILVITPDTTKWAHMEYALLCETETEIKMYEGTTTSNDGTGLTEVNRNRNSAVAATVAVSYTPTVAGGAEGTLLRTKHFSSSKTTTSETRGLHEWILKQNTKYLFRITNITASNNWITIILNWYEHTNR